MENRNSDKPTDDNAAQRENAKLRELEEETDEFFGGVVDDEDLSASETDEDADEGTGDGEMGRNGNDFPGK
ncbi:MAG TPA: hypothetical protein VKZ68_10635 [Ohtaekwangia sp.]|nr:hypothetical protein [Ohtaekwangia sp.]